MPIQAPSFCHQGPLIPKWPLILSPPTRTVLESLALGFYFFTRKRNEFLQRRFFGFWEEKAQIFFQWEKCLTFCEYIHSHASWFAHPPPVSVQSTPFLWMLSHSHCTILFFYDHITSHHIIPPILAIRLSQSNSHSHSLTETHLHHLFQFNSPHSFHHIQGAVLLPLSSLGFSLCCLQINSNLNPKIQRTSKDSWIREKMTHKRIKRFWIEFWIWKALQRSKWLKVRSFPLES